ncbi:PH domain-containing protein [Dactylosporangium sp. NPDC051541]|uniref:PH domain-containing protein n=1 Tax=Dactylosporangium sp. NPDC051541 TaxID=3363977 RepID=UPI0037A37A11
MGFPESVLTKDEQVVLHLHPHWKALFLPVVWFVLAVAAFVTLAILTSWGMIPLLIVAGVLVVILFVITVWPWVKWRTTHYVFTNERVIMRSGVFSRSGRDIPMGRINDVSFSHSLFERMLGCGTLTIESAGERGQVQLTNLPQVEKTQSVLYELVDADRQKHTFGDDDRDALVREIKNDPEPAS